MDWFIGFNENSTTWFQDMIKVAVISARENTHLKAHCLYDGKDTPLLGWLESNGVQVIRDSVPFREELFSVKVLSANHESGFNPVKATGHFLRILVAKYATTENVLYTDCDVMFLGDIDVPELPCLGVVREISGFGFNTGVMIFNRTHLSEIYEKLIEHFREHNFFDAKHRSYDQSLLNRFYKNYPVTYIDAVYNWRPFQGINEGARIVHFHGPKPHRIASIIAGNTVPGEENLLDYIQRDRESYLYYLDRFNHFLSRA